MNHTWYACTINSPQKLHSICCHSYFHETICSKNYTNKLFSIKHDARLGPCAIETSSNVMQFSSAFCLNSLSKECLTVCQDTMHTLSNWLLNLGICSNAAEIKTITLTNGDCFLYFPGRVNKSYPLLCPFINLSANPWTKSSHWIWNHTILHCLQHPFHCHRDYILDCFSNWPSKKCTSVIPALLQFHYPHSHFSFSFLGFHHPSTIEKVMLKLPPMQMCNAFFHKESHIFPPASIIAVEMTNLLLH